MMSRIAWLYTGLVAAAAVALMATGLPHDVPPRFWADLVILQLLFLICDSTPALMAARQSAWSPSTAASLAAVVLVGPFGAALVGAVSVVSLHGHLRLARRLFNGGHVRAVGLPGRPGLRGPAAQLPGRHPRTGRRGRPTSRPCCCRSPPPPSCTCWPTTA